MQGELHRMQEQEMLNLRQKAHVKWLTQGDQGTTFFARETKGLHIKNSLMRIVNQNGKQMTSMHEMKQRIVEYLKRLYSYEQRNLNLDFSDAISNEMATWLRRYPTIEEIKEVLHGMSKGKLSRLDDMTIEILVYHWNTIKEDMLEAILHFFRNQIRMLCPLNHTFIVLIPKVGVPSTLGEYIPISCMGGSLQSNSVALCKQIIYNTIKLG